MVHNYWSYKGQAKGWQWHYHYQTVILLESDTKDKQGVAVALSQPDSDSSGIKNKVFSGLTLDDLKKIQY